MRRERDVSVAKYTVAEIRVHLLTVKNAVYNASGDRAAGLRPNQSVNAARRRRI